MITAGIPGMLLLQSATPAGALPAARPRLSLTAPGDSGLPGMLAFGERGPGRCARLTGAVSVAVTSVLALAGSPPTGHAGRGPGPGACAGPGVRR